MSDTELGLTRGRGGALLSSALLMAALGLTALAASSIAVGPLGAVHLAMLAATALALTGLGDLAFTLTGGVPAWLPPLSGRAVTGLALATLVVGALYRVVPLQIAFWLVIALGAVGVALCAVRGVRARARGALRVPSASLGLDALAIAALGRLGTLHPEWTWTLMGRAYLARHLDLYYHLALVKELVLRGTPLRDVPMLSGSTPGPYHIAFDALAAAVVKSLPVPLDETYFRVLLPAVFGAFVLSAGVVAAALARRRLAAPIAVGLLVFVYSLLAAEGAGYGFGRETVAYFYNNPTAALGVPFAAAAVALLVAAHDGFAASRLALASVLVAATLMVKANLALALVPAFAIVAIAGVARGWWRTRGMLVAAAAGAVAAVVARLSIGGGEGGVTVRWGAYARYITELPTRALVPTPTSAIAASVSSWGPLGDVVIIGAHLLFDIGGVLSLVALAWVLSRKERRDPSAGAWLLGSFVVIAFVIALTLVQPEAGRFTAWNIAAHTVQNAQWIIAAFGAAGIALVLSGPLEDTRTFGVASLALLLALVPALNAPQIGLNRGHKVPRPFLELVKDLPKTTETYDVVAQSVETSEVTWVSGLGGRRTVLERGESFAASQPEEVGRRIDLLQELYSTQSRERVRAIAEELGVTVAIVHKAAAEGAIASAGTEIDRSGNWATIRLAPAPEAAPGGDAR